MLAQLLIIVIVLAIILYLLDRYVIPLVPAPWGQIIMVIIVIIIILFLLSRYLGVNL